MLPPGARPSSCTLRQAQENPKWVELEGRGGGGGSPSLAAFDEPAFAGSEGSIRRREVSASGMRTKKQDEPDIGQQEAEAIKHLVTRPSRFPLFRQSRLETDAAGMPPTPCSLCHTARALVKRPKTGQQVCKSCFYEVFETEVHNTLIQGRGIFRRGERVAIGASGGKGEASFRTRARR